jgi:predicted DNA-binding WGR domain protein
MKIHLRYDNPDGSSKDWFGEAHNGGVNISWGKTGRTMQGIFLNPMKCKNNSPFQELEQRANKKRQKGYYDLHHNNDKSSAIRPESDPVVSPQDTAKISAAIDTWSAQSSGSWF